MVLTKDVELPQYAELHSREVNVSTATLMTAAPYLGKMCENINSEFMLCRQETNDPRPCVELGKRVTECAIQVFQRIRKECLEEFKQYAHCIEKSSGDFSYSHCRKTQCAFDDCMQTKICVNRPEFGYFCRARVHSSLSKAPKAPPCPCHPPVPDPTPALPDCKIRERARFGSRVPWIMDE